MSAPRSPAVPRVYAAIAAITADLARTGIAKSHIHADERYAYRSIDDVCRRLAPLLARHRLCILPRVIERDMTDAAAGSGGALVRVAVRAAFDIVSARDGSCHSIEAYGEALDADDKATAKAVSAAYKQAVQQAFCVPVEGAEDADTSTHRLATQSDVPDPDQGWDQWSADLQDMVRICESDEALARVQTTYRSLLRAASKRRPDVFAVIGTAIAARRADVTRPVAPACSQRPVPNGKAHAHV